MTSRRPDSQLLADTVDRWQDQQVVVVGDVLLDEWRFTDAQRLAREAPTPVVTLRHQEYSAGGAGNTAANLAALCARPELIAPVGDAAGRRVRACLARAGVTDRTVTVPGHRTGTKRRVVAGDQILFCEEDPRTTAPAVPGLIEALAATAAGGSRPVLVVCDYGLGALDEVVRRWLVAHRDDFGLVVLDAHDLGRWAGLAPTAVTPSWTEALPLLGPGAPDAGPADRAEAVVRGGAALLAATGAGVAAVTLDVAGAVVLGAGEPYRTWAEPAPAGHTVGAGDAYTAALALGLSVGAPVPVAAELAQLAAGATLGGTGTTTCTRDALLAAVGDRPGGVVDAATLAGLVRRRRERGARVVFTNGCFDVLHRGHVGFLTQARQLGDVLVVAVNSDDSVRRLKGPERPVNPVEDRVAVLAALGCVDHVVVFAEDSPTALLETLRPDVYVKGGDYRPELVPEAPLVRRLGGEVRTLGYVPDRSTSAIIDRIRSRAPVPDARP